MTTTLVTRGSIPEIIHNGAGLYPGNLVGYFQAVFLKAQNCSCPYHNFRHMTHVLWLCHDACQFYAKRLSQREKRNLLIAALFHDYDHSGMFGHDDLNIERSVRGLKQHLQEADRPEFENIENIIRPTEYPYKVASEELSLSCQIIRDADLSQALSVAWIQQVIFGLAGEWRTKPIEVLRAQAGFLEKLRFSTAWARQAFPQAMIDQKIEEAKELLKLLD